MTPGLLSVVIVNYNGESFLRECLTALAQQSFPRHRLEVIVVDNASTDGSADCVRCEFPWVRWLALRENRGFAGGNNAGFDIARGEWIALVNNDTHVDPYWLAAAILAFDPAIGGVSSKLVFHSHPHQMNSAGLQLLPDGRGKDIGFRTEDDGRFEEPREVFAGCGAALVVRRSLIDAVGGFDERFFMYCEDLDLGWKAHFKGWRFVYQPSSLVRHVHCGSSGEWSPFFAFHLERNRVWVNLQNSDPFLAIWTILGFVARVGRAMVRRRRGLLKAYLRAALSLGWRLPTFLMDRHAIRSLGSRKRLPCMSS